MDIEKHICHIGDKASITKTFTEKDIRDFAEMTFDDNGMHLDKDMSRKGLFRRPVVHGVLVGSLISSVMGTKLPGKGTILQHEDIAYLNPVYPGETVTADVELISVEEHDKYYIAELNGICKNQDGVVVTKALCRQLMLKRFFLIEQSDK